MKNNEIINFKISIILVLKELRKQKGNISQASVNTDILEKIGFTHNMGRSEVDGNFKMETLYIYCLYFEITAAEFFRRVGEVKKEDIEFFKKEQEERKRKKNA
ncbi:hypothetical protein B4N84_12950 [Flavobacterium sp. IR1]|nr:hypothetical protein B4N84_12950 [Flavobacterium sp. IR1]